MQVFVSLFTLCCSPITNIIDICKFYTFKLFTTIIFKFINIYFICLTVHIWLPLTAWSRHWPVLRCCFRLPFTTAAAYDTCTLCRLRDHLCLPCSLSLFRTLSRLSKRFIRNKWYFVVLRNEIHTLLVSIKPNYGIIMLHN